MTLPVPPVVDVEVVLLRLEQPRQLCYRTLRRRLAEGETPDDVALLVAGDHPTVSHSTSWRYEPPGLVVLTYAVLPDPDTDVAAVPLVGPAVVCSGNPARPTPANLHGHHIAAHAVRHLAYLARHDPAIANVARSSRHQELWETLHAVAAGIPSGTHAAAHQQAAGTHTAADRR